MEERRVFVYDSLDVPRELLERWHLDLTFGVAPEATGRSRPKMSPSALVDAAMGHQALLGASGAIVDAAVIEALPDLRYIAKLGIGWEVIDIPAASARDIVVTNTPVHSEVEQVAEHAVSLILACCKQFSWYNTAYVRSGGWRDGKHFLGCLDGATVGIVGYGHIGRAVARRLHGWNVELLVHDVSPVHPDEGRAVDLDVLLRHADVVTLHTPGLPGGAALLDRARLELLKPGAIVVNTARGALVDKIALAELLVAGKVGAAGVDVYQPEPPSEDDPLLNAPNVYATPHVAAWSRGIRVEMVEMALSGLCDLFDGKVPQHVVNPEVLERRSQDGE